MNQPCLFVKKMKSLHHHIHVPVFIPVSSLHEDKINSTEHITD